MSTNPKVRSGLHVEPAVLELPASRADLEEEEEQHEHQAGADVQDQTQAHVNAGEAQDPPSGAGVEPDLGPLGSPPVQHHRRRPGGGLLLLLLQGLDCALGFLGSLGRRQRGGGQVALRLGEVARREVAGSVVLSEEGQDLLLVPRVDALLLLVAGGAEGGAGPGRFGEHRVVTEGTCKTRMLKGSPS